MELLKLIQSDLMLLLGGVCASITQFGLLTHSSRLKKIGMFMMGTGATVLLVADHYAYAYRGDVSLIGYWMVRICNFLVFFMTIVIIHGHNIYLFDMLKNEIHLNALSRLKISEIIIFIGEIMVVVSQFTGLYYTFDASNYYQRSEWFSISYIIPLTAWGLQFSVILQHRKKLDRAIFLSMTLFTTLPIAASLLQAFIYGFSFTNLTLAMLVINLRINEVISTNQKIRLAQKREKELLLTEQENLQTMVEETALALAEAIDAKDRYTHGHSSRVASYSVMIAKECGMNETECQNIYLVGLLHDVGKIGIPEDIINKDSKLTDEEYAVIKAHPVIGNQILQRISKNPTLCIGAHYHHERYDGSGYPDGLKGEEIPKIARIIAVADAYDAMTSKRSYRNSLPQDVVRREIENGMGTQFDPRFAQIMLMLIDRDTEYKMREC